MDAGVYVSDKSWYHLPVLKTVLLRADIQHWVCQRVLSFCCVLSLQSELFTEGRYPMSTLVASLPATSKRILNTLMRSEHERLALHLEPAKIASGWLLRCQDRAHSKELALTLEFISMMLGTRRAGITEAAGQLQHAGLINYKRGQITIIDRAGLEAKSSECYGVVKKEFNRLLGN
jgi:Crp-like helix-turn-helix domain